MTTYNTFMKYYKRWTWCVIRSAFIRLHKHATVTSVWKKNRGLHNTLWLQLMIILSPQMSCFGHKSTIFSLLSYRRGKNYSMWKYSHLRSWKRRIFILYHIKCELCNNCKQSFVSFPKLSLSFCCISKKKINKKKDFWAGTEVLSYFYPTPDRSVLQRR